MKTIGIITRDVSILFFSCILLIGCKKKTPILQHFITQDGIEVTTEYVDQGAYGSYVEVSLEKDGLPPEVIFLRSEDAKPMVDSLVDNIIYIHYDGYPSKDSILQPQRVLLGESLFNNFGYQFHISNKIGK